MPSRKKANGRARRRRAEKSRAAATAQNHDSLVGEGGVQMQMHNMIHAVKMNRDGDGAVTVPEAEAALAAIAQDKGAVLGLAADAPNDT